MSIRPTRSLLNPELRRPSALNSIPRDPAQIWLDKNENLDPQLMALTHEVLSSIPREVLATYPEAGMLYRKLARWVGVSPESLLLTPGSDGAIRLAFERMRHGLHAAGIGARQFIDEVDDARQAAHVHRHLLLGDGQPRKVCDFFDVLTGQAHRLRAQSARQLTQNKL